MHPLGCSLTTLVIHFHARHLQKGCPGQPGSDQINGDRINGLCYTLLLNGVYWGYNPLIRSPLIRSLPVRDIQMDVIEEMA